MTKLFLLKNIPLDPNYETTIDFKDANEQLNYFRGFIDSNIDTTREYSYLRTNGDIQVPISYEELEGINYLYYINNKTVYYNFVTSKEYINPSTTLIHIELDVFQTRMFNYTLGECFVEREHQDRVDDYKTTYKFNLENENLEIGPDYEMIFNGKLGINTRFAYPDIMWYYIWNTADTPVGDASTIANIKGYSTNLNCRLMPILMPSAKNNGKGIIWQGKYIEKSFTDYSHNAFVISKLSKETTTVSIQACRYPPFKATITLNSDGNYVIDSSDEISTNNVPDDDNVVPIWITKQNNEGKLITHTVSIKKVGPEFDNVVLGTNKRSDREPKLKTHPYKFLKISYADQSKSYKFELFDKDTDFNLYKSVAPNSSTIIYPVNYAGDDLGNELVSVNDNEQALRTDAWINYYNNNKASLRSGLLTKIGSSALTTGIGIASGGVGLAVAGISAVNTTTSVIQEMQKRQDIRETPDGIKTTGDDLGAHLLDDEMFGELEVYEIKKQFKTKVFNYFYRLGYACREYKTPDLKSRYYFNFIKMGECTLINKGLNSDEVETIKNIYKNGVTIWHYRDPSTFDYLNYNLENWETKLI